MGGAWGRGNTRHSSLTNANTTQTNEDCELNYATKQISWHKLAWNYHTSRLCALSGFCTHWVVRLEYQEASMANWVLYTMHKNIVFW